MSLADVVYFLFLLVVVAAAAATTFVRRGGPVERWRRKGHNVPPGSMGWPFIGETLAFLQLHPVNTHGDFIEGRIHRYGKIFTSHLLGVPTVVSADPDLNQFVLRNDGKLFSPKAPKIVIDMMGRNSLVTAEGDVHRKTKSLLVNFFDISWLRGRFVGDADSFVKRTLSTWEEETTVCITEAARKLIFNLLVKHILSMDPGNPETDSLNTKYISLTKGLRALIPFNIPGTAYRKALQPMDDCSNLLMPIWTSEKPRRVPVLVLLQSGVGKSEPPIRTEQQMSITIKAIVQLTNELMEERLRHKKEETGSIKQEDFLDYLLEQSDLTGEQISDLILPLLLAGHETTTSALSLAVYYLMDCPKAVEQLREEHLNIISAKKQRDDDVALSWEDYRKMEFTHSVVRETLRLGNPARYAFRKADTDIHYKGYDIPRGWGIILLISTAHLELSEYPDPDKFNPWRWQTGSTTTTRTENYLPFGRGIRKCTGGQFTDVVISVFLHHLILNYNWEPTEPDHPSASMLAEFPKGFPVKVRKLY